MENTWSLIPRLFSSRPPRESASNCSRTKPKQNLRLKSLTRAKESNRTCLTGEPVFWEFWFPISGPLLSLMKHWLLLVSSTVKFFTYSFPFLFVTILLRLWKRLPWNCFAWVYQRRRRHTQDHPWYSSIITRSIVFVWWPKSRDPRRWPSTKVWSFWRRKTTCWFKRTRASTRPKTPSSSGFLPSTTTSGCRLDSISFCNFLLFRPSEIKSLEEVWIEV